MRGFSDRVAPHSFNFTSYGVDVELRATSEEILERMVAEALPPSLEPLDERREGSRRFGIVQEDDGQHSVYNATTQVSNAGPLGLALVVLETQLRSWIAMSAPSLIFVHAGAVAHDGKAIIIPGDSFSGKTTLVEALVRRGAAYFSDEFAVIDADGLVHPFAKPLSIRINNNTEEIQSPVHELGGVAGDEAVPLGTAVMTYYVPGGKWEPRRLSSGEGALAFLSNTVAARTRPEEALQALSKAAQGATILEGERGEADDFAELLLSGRVAA